MICLFISLILYLVLHLFSSCSPFTFHSFFICSFCVFFSIFPCSPFVFLVFHIRFPLVHLFSDYFPFILHLFSICSAFVFHLPYVCFSFVVIYFTLILHFSLICSPFVFVFIYFPFIFHLFVHLFHSHLFRRSFAILSWGQIWFARGQGSIPFCRVIDFPLEISAKPTEWMSRREAKFSGKDSARQTWFRDKRAAVIQIEMHVCPRSGIRRTWRHIQDAQYCHISLWINSELILLEWLRGKMVEKEIDR